MKLHLVPTAVAHVVPAAAVGLLARSALAALLVWLIGMVAFVPHTNAYLRGERAAFGAAYFVHWTAGLIAFPVALVSVTLAIAFHWSPTLALALPYALGLLLATYGALLRRRLVQTHRIELPVSRLHRGFDGYRIAHISDLHIGPWTPRAWGMRWSRAVNDLACDLVVVTGDLVTNGSAFHEDAADVIGALRAKDGVVVAMGNHDYYGDGEGLIRKLRARGVRVLRNESEDLVRGDARLCLAGLDDRASRRSSLDRALEDRTEGDATVLLAHDPVDFRAACGRGVDVVLSGHTHGGQLAVPGLARHANIGRFSREHTLGVYERGDSRLVVHPGLGTSGPPVRIGAAPAILAITLRTTTARRSESPGSTGSPPSS
jgi:predicted MPP superfamily phosphohydrolase